MNRFPPAPRCPAHTSYMRYRFGTFPNRYYRCSRCGDWHENGFTNGQVSLVRAFANGSTSLERVEPREIKPYIHEPCERSHVGPVVGTLAIVGGVVVAVAVLSAIFGDD